MGDHRTSVVAFVTLSGGVISGPAASQSTSSGGQDGNPVASADTASSRESSWTRSQEEIVVTARRRDENLMELPMSIRAIDSDEMRDLGIHNIQDISEFVPNVSLSETQRKNDPLMFIRGIGGGFRNPNRVFGTAM